MTLQNIFYVVAILFMSLSILLLVAGVVILFYIKKRITEIAQSIQRKIDQATEFVSHPKRIASQIGSAIVDTTLTYLVSKPKTRKR